MAFAPALGYQLLTGMLHALSKPTGRTATCSLLVMQQTRNNKDFKGGRYALVLEDELYKKAPLYTPREVQDRNPVIGPGDTGVGLHRRLTPFPPCGSYA